MVVAASDGLQLVLRAICNLWGIINGVSFFVADGSCYMNTDVLLQQSRTYSVRIRNVRFSYSCSRH